MSKELETIEVIDESKEALTEAANDQETSVGKVVVLAGLAVATAAGAAYGLYKFLQKKKDHNVVDGEATIKDADEPVEDDTDLEE